MEDKRAVTPEATAIASFTLLSELLIELHENKVITSEQKDGIVRAAMNRNEAQGNKANSDAAYLLSQLL